MIRRVLVIVLLALIPVDSADAQSTLTLRGRSAPLPGQVSQVGPDGVVLAVVPTAGSAPGSTEKVVSWDLVARVDGELATEALAYLPMAENLWRARTRLERGDAVGAEPIFEELYARYSGRRGPTASVIAGGLLRCRLLEGAQTAAVPTFLSYINAQPVETHAAFLMPSFEPSTAVAIDGTLQLAPGLPPIWVDLPSVQALARGTWPLVSGEDHRARALILQDLYQQAARFESGMPAVVTTHRIEKDDGLGLVADIVMSRIGDDAQRAAARSSLTNRLSKRPPGWVQVWCRVAIGRSLLRDPDRESQLLGINELLEVPARFERVNPYLTGIALAEAAVALHRLDDKVGATRLRSDLNDNLAGHPAIEWEALRRWPNAAPAKPQPTLPLPRTTSDDLAPNGGPD